MSIKILDSYYKFGDANIIIDISNTFTVEQTIDISMNGVDVSNINVSPGVTQLSFSDSSFNNTEDSSNSFDLSNSALNSLGTPAINNLIKHFVVDISTNGQYQDPSGTSGNLYFHNYSSSHNLPSNNYNSSVILKPTDYDVSFVLHYRSTDTDISKALVDTPNVISDLSQSLVYLKSHGYALPPSLRDEYHVFFDMSSNYDPDDNSGNEVKSVNYVFLKDNPKTANYEFYSYGSYLYVGVNEDFIKSGVVTEAKKNKRLKILFNMAFFQVLLDGTYDVLESEPFAKERLWYTVASSTFMSAVGPGSSDISGSQIYNNEDPLFSSYLNDFLRLRQLSFANLSKSREYGSYILLKYLNERTTDVSGLTSGIQTDISNSYVEKVWELFRQDTQYNPEPSVKTMREYLGRALKERTPIDFTRSATEKFEDYLLDFWQTILFMLSYVGHIIHLKNDTLNPIFSSAETTGATLSNVSNVAFFQDKYLANLDNSANFLLNDTEYYLNVIKQYGVDTNILDPATMFFYDASTNAISDVDDANRKQYMRRINIGNADAGEFIMSRADISGTYGVEFIYVDTSNLPSSQLNPKNLDIDIKTRSTWDSRDDEETTVSRFDYRFFYIHRKMNSGHNVVGGSQEQHDFLRGELIITNTSRNNFQYLIPNVRKNDLVSILIVNVQPNSTATQEKNIILRMIYSSQIVTPEAFFLNNTNNAKVDINYDIITKIDIPKSILLNPVGTTNFKFEIDKDKINAKSKGFYKYISSQNQSIEFLTNENLNYTDISNVVIDSEFTSDELYMRFEFDVIPSRIIHGYKLYWGTDELSLDGNNLSISTNSINGDTGRVDIMDISCGNQNNSSVTLAGNSKNNPNYIFLDSTVSPSLPGRGIDISNTVFAEYIPGYTDNNANVILPKIRVEFNRTMIPPGKTRIYAVSYNTQNGVFSPWSTAGLEKRATVKNVSADNPYYLESRVKSVRTTDASSNNIESARLIFMSDENNLRDAIISIAIPKEEGIVRFFNRDTNIYSGNSMEEINYYAQGNLRYEIYWAKKTGESILLPGDYGSLSADTSNRTIDDISGVNEFGRVIPNHTDFPSNAVLHQHTYYYSYQNDHIVTINANSCDLKYKFGDSGESDVRLKKPSDATGLVVEMVYDLSRNHHKQIFVPLKVKNDKPVIDFQLTNISIPGKYANIFFKENDYGVMDAVKPVAYHLYWGNTRQEIVNIVDETSTGSLDGLATIPSLISSIDTLSTKSTNGIYSFTDIDFSNVNIVERPYFLLVADYGDGDLTNYTVIGLTESANIYETISFEIPEGKTGNDMRTIDEDLQTISGEIIITPGSYSTNNTVTHYSIWWGIEKNSVIERIAQELNGGEIFDPKSENYPSSAPVKFNMQNHRIPYFYDESIDDMIKPTHIIGYSMEISGNNIRLYETSKRSIKISERYPALANSSPINVVANKNIGGIMTALPQSSLSQYDGTLGKEAFKGGDNFTITINFARPFEFQLGSGNVMSNFKLSMSSGGEAIGQSISAGKDSIVFKYVLDDSNFNTNSSSPLSIVGLTMENGAKLYDPISGYSWKTGYWEQMYGNTNLPVSIIIENDSIDMNKDGEIDVLDLVLLINKYNSGQ